MILPSELVSLKLCCFLGAKLWCLTQSWVQIVATAQGENDNHLERRWDFLLDNKQARCGVDRVRAWKDTSPRTCSQPIFPDRPSMQVPVTITAVMLLAGDPGTGWDVQFWVLLNTLFSPGAPGGQGSDYWRWLLSPSTLLRSSHYCIAGACWGPAGICTTFCTNTSDVNTRCQRPYSASEKARQRTPGMKWPRGDKNCLRSQT